jgi:hypothetical protein
MRFPFILWPSLRIHRAAAWVVVVAGLAGGLPGDARAAPLEYQVKAGFLYNFAKFIEWPAAAFEKPQTPYSICVLGPDPFGEDLDVAVGEATLQGRRLVVRRLGDPKNAGGCHILFVSKTDPGKLPALFQSLAGAPTLTVGEDEEFTRAGGGLRFFWLNNTIRFEINLQATERARLKISAKLLNLARVVGKSPGKN